MTKYILYVACLAFLPFCKQKPAPESSEALVAKLKTSNWNCISVDPINFCSPKHWRKEEQKTGFYFSYLGNNKDANNFFGILRYVMDSKKVTAMNYLKSVYEQVKSDTTERFAGYTIKKLVLSDATIFNCQYYSRIAGRDFVTHSMLFEFDGFLYDVCLKSDELKFKEYDGEFAKVLLSFRVGKQYIFGKDKQIKKIESVDLSKL
jgi:hypothetical protein